MFLDTLSTLYKSCTRLGLMALDPVMIVWCSLRKWLISTSSLASASFCPMCYPVPIPCSNRLSNRDPGHGVDTWKRAHTSCRDVDRECRLLKHRFAHGRASDLAQLEVK